MKAEEERAAKERQRRLEDGEAARGDGVFNLEMQVLHVCQRRSAFPALCLCPPWCRFISFQGSAERVSRRERNTSASTICARPWRPQVHSCPSRLPRVAPFASVLVRPFLGLSISLVCRLQAIPRVRMGTSASRLHHSSPNFKVA